jgi:hypothetical protein
MNVAKIAVKGMICYRSCGFYLTFNFPGRVGMAHVPGRDSINLARCLEF